MLSLDKQTRYRERYRMMLPGWRPSGEVYESLIRNQIERVAQNGCRARLLDAGCGTGGVIELFSRSVALPIGIDADVMSLRHHRDDAVIPVAGSVTALPFTDDTFDLVISSWVLEHVEQPSLFFAEVARVLKSGGHFIALTPNARNLVTLLNRMTPRSLQAGLVRLIYAREEQDTFPVEYRANTVEAIDSLARSAGLYPVTLDVISDPTYLAFNDALFYLSVALERFTPRNRYVHIVADCVKH